MNREVHLVSRPGVQGVPSANNFKVVDSDYPSLTDGNVVIKTLYLSVDPATRCQMNCKTGVHYLKPWPLNQRIEGLAGIGVITESSSSKYKTGDCVMKSVAWPWALFFATNTENLQKIDPAVVGGQLSLYISYLGLIGLTTLLGIREKAHIVRGDNQTVVVSAAAGACGSIAGQIAKAEGCGKLIGICGSDEKCQILLDELKYDVAINYKTEDVASRVKSECPNIVSVYFDNVGGEISDTIIRNMTENGNIVLCGQISQYNKTSRYPPILKPEISEILKQKNIRRDRFLVLSYQDKFAQGLNELGQLLAAGKIKVKETIKEGLDATPDAFVGMMTGENIGKMLVHVADP